MTSMFSHRLSNLSPSETLAMSQKSNELREQGIDVINMSVGEPDFATPSHIKAAANEAIANNFTFYSPVSGYKDLREAICAKLQKENNLTFSPNQIVVSNGAKQALCNVILALVDRGDEVIIPTPYWVSYPEMVRMAEGTPVFIPTSIDDDFKITPQQLENAITPKTKAIVLCSPSNPTGSVYSAEELAQIADVISKHPDIFVISDEIYEHITYVGKHASIAHVESVRERTIIINGVSKGYAMTGWRIGWIAAPKTIADACSMLQGQYTSGACSVSQKAALQAYNGSQDCVEEMRQAFEKRCTLILSLLKEIPNLHVNTPQGAFYVLPDFSLYLGKAHNGNMMHTATDLAMFLLEDAHVACVSGDAFGAPGCIRFSYACSEEHIIEAVSRITQSIKKLK